MKKSRLANEDIQFECDTSISLSSDLELNLKTPSPKKLAAKKLENKRRPEDFEQECRRSTRARTSTLAGKFGNAIPISKMEDQGTRSKNVICHTNNTNTGKHRETTATTSREEPQEVNLLSSSVNPVGLQNTRVH